LGTPIPIAVLLPPPLPLALGRPLLLLTAASLRTAARRLGRPSLRFGPRVAARLFLGHRLSAGGPGLARRLAPPVPEVTPPTAAAATTTAVTAGRR
jgi:hypothetical protein